MAIVPMKQEIKKTRSSGELNAWGKPEKVETVVLKCRATEGSHTTTDRSSKIVGATIVCELKLIFDKLADITYDDEISYVNEAETEFKGRPKNIKISRDLGGKPILTTVYL
ncbi:hypothetical protein COM97_27000 [Bacillus thuringiensis]|uniref:hypothetical protein n=1 Tax=Bacillus thuringiensis TaxID=1428 RepID=UPI000BEC4120|nr:hypothetical protein [Bacillus thuringiensis]PEF03391.1 hypothetical protein COM97_27000 [Bacillus thuringiensis]